MKFSIIKIVDINVFNSYVREIMMIVCCFVIIEVYLNGYLMDKIWFIVIDNKFEIVVGVINCESL